MKRTIQSLIVLSFLALVVGCCSDIREEKDPVEFGILGEHKTTPGTPIQGTIAAEEPEKAPAVAPGSPECCKVLEQRLNDLEKRLASRDQRITQLEQMVAAKGNSGTAAPVVRTVRAGGLRIEHTGPQTGTPNAVIPFNIKVINDNNYPLQDVRLFSQLSEGTDFVSASDNGQYNPGTRTIEWDLGTINGNSNRTVTYEVRVGATGTYEVCAWATYQMRECVTVKIVQPMLTCEVTAPPQGMTNKPFQMCVVIRNTGDGPANEVVATVNLPAGVTFDDGSSQKTWTAGTVAAGGTARQCWNVTASNSGRVSINVNVVGQGGLTTDCSSVTDVVTPDLAITKSAPRRAHLGREFTYKIEVRNSGSADATNVQLVDQLPEGVEFKEASEGGQYRSGSRTVEWNLGTMRPGESRNFSVRVKAMRENMDPGWCNTAKVTCAEGIVREDQAVTLVEAVPAMHIDSYDTEDPVQVGDTTVYVITVRNEGQKDATQVQLKVTLPDKTSYVSHDAVTGIEAGSVKINGIYDAASRTVIFDPIPVTHPGDSATFKVQVRVEDVGDELSTAILTFAEFTRPIEVQEPTKYYK